MEGNKIENGDKLANIQNKMWYVHMSCGNDMCCNATHFHFCQMCYYIQRYFCYFLTYIQTYNTYQNFNKCVNQDDNKLSENTFNK